MIPLHGIASREDLPLPFPLVVAGGAFTLVITFVILFWAWRTPRYEEADGRPLPRLTSLVDSGWFRWPLRVLVAAVWAVAGLALVAGVDRLDNPVFGFVLVWIWVGLVPAALLLGRVHRLTNPVRLLTGFSPPGEKMGSVWPAALAVTAFFYLELVEPRGLELRTMQLFAAVWLVWLVAGRLITSRAWVARADPFEAFASTVSRMSPWSRHPSGMLMLTHPLRNLSSWRPPRHFAILACVLLAGTLFDAIAASAWWVRGLQVLGINAHLAGTVGLLLTIGIVWGAFQLCAIPLRGGGSASTAADRLAPSLVPLLAGYSLSHYATYLYLEGQRTAFRMSDPLSLGWNLFGSAELGPNTTLFMFPGPIAVLQVLLIVGGHVLGALVAHDISLRTSRRIGAQLPLLLVMVCLTVGGLLLMFGS